MSERILLPLSPIEFATTLRSHGWSHLPPSQVSTEPLSLRIPYHLPAGSGWVELTNGETHIELNIGAGTASTGCAVADACVSLDIPMTALYQYAARHAEWRWLTVGHFGRFLRSPSLYEDCVKILLTLNTTFRRTIQMTALLVEQYGEPVGPYTAFPTPQRLLQVGEQALRQMVKCGFRAKYLLNLATHALAQPELFLADGWRQLPAESFAEMLSAVVGMGPVSVGYIARMYGKPAGFAVDAYVQRRCRELWGIPPAEIAAFAGARYAVFGSLAPSVFWFEMTRHWHQQAA